MPTVLVRGLTDEGPGDIVGAFAGEADVDPDRIGEISIDDEEAAVDLSLPEDALADVLETMDGNRVGRSEVSVTQLDETTRAVQAYVDEPRRFNVALTRARRKAVVVGDGETVTAADVFDDFLGYVRDGGTIIDGS